MQVGIWNAHLKVKMSIPLNVESAHMMISFGIWLDIDLKHLDVFVDLELKHFWFDYRVNLRCHEEPEIRFGYWHFQSDVIRKSWMYIVYELIQTQELTTIGSLLQEKDEIVSYLESAGTLNWAH
jgi:hypothetical protein